MFKRWFGKKEEAEVPASPGEQPGSDEEGTGKTPAREAASPEVAAPRKGRWAFLRDGFRKTRAGLTSLFGLRGKLDEAALEQIEADLLTADFGPAMVQQLIDGEEGLRAAWKSKRIESQEQVLDFLKSHLKSILHRRENTLRQGAQPPSIYLIAGVNGTGKTTSIAKLAHRLRREGKTVLLAAADTFRAAAVEQLTIWSERLGIGIVKGEPRADPASVAYTGIERAVREGVDYLIVDTAGRLHTDKNLMRELRKIRDVIARKVPGAPHECLLVLDSTNGQNAIQQAEIYKREIDVSGIILTKLDGTAKGGVVFAIHERVEIPVKLVGIGEQVEDLTLFDAEKFVEALFEE